MYGPLTWEREDEDGREAAKEVDDEADVRNDDGECERRDEPDNRRGDTATSLARDDGLRRQAEHGQPDAVEGRPDRHTPGIHQNRFWQYNIKHD